MLHLKKTLEFSFYKYSLYFITLHCFNKFHKGTIASGVSEATYEFNIFLGIDVSQR